MKRSKRSAAKNIFQSPVMLIIIFAVFVFVAHGSWQMFIKARLSRDKLVKAEKELSGLEERKKELFLKIARLSTEQGVEAELRTKYRAARDGESLAVIVGNPVSPYSATSSGSIGVITWWHKVLIFFGLSK